MHISWSIESLTELDLILRDGVVPELSISLPDAANQPKGTVIRNWLNEVRKKDGQARQVVIRMIQSEHWLRIAAFFCSVFLGVAAAKGLLWYDGQHLINVGIFLGVLVFGQISFLVFTFLAAFLVRSSSGGVYRKILSHFTGHIPLRRSAPLWKLRTFQSMQLAGVGFNFGVLGTTALHGITRDLAFGWATTLKIEVGTIARLLQIISWPWGGAFTPNTSEIAGSRIVLLEGFQFVDPDAAATWWPFLMLCIICYGLLPRFLLVITSGLLFRHRLRSLKLTDPITEQIWLSLTRERVDFSPPTGADHALPQQISATLHPYKPQGSMQLLLPAELADQGEHISVRLTKQLSVPVEICGQSSPEALQPSPGGLIHLTESWQPPLEETRQEFIQLREAMGPSTSIVICLVGLPTNSPQIFMPPEPEDVEIWSNMLASLQDPYLHAMVWQPIGD